VQATSFDEEAFFRAVAECGARAILIGRRALVALGIPVGTLDYDYWVHIDDAALFNRPLEAMGLSPTVHPRKPARPAATCLRTGNVSMSSSRVRCPW
jgi:hypothetical protein